MSSGAGSGNGAHGRFSVRGSSASMTSSTSVGQRDCGCNAALCRLCDRLSEPSIGTPLPRSLRVIEAKEPAHQVAFYELLGHLFYFKFKEEETPGFAEKSIVFYELFLQKSGIFSMPIVSRISELKANV